MNKPIEDAIVKVLDEVGKVLKRVYSLVGVLIEWYPVHAGRPILTKLRWEKVSDEERRAVADDAKLIVRDTPGAPE